LKKITWIALTLAALGGACIGIILTIIYRELPSIEAIRDIRLKEPLRIYTIDGRLIAEYGNKKRITTTMDQVPGALVNAILAAEDDGFFDHYGVDFAGIARAVLANLRAGGIDQGASTITMQVARNYFLTREKTYTRKIKEVLLALTLEQALSKNEILLDVASDLADTEVEKFGELAESVEYENAEDYRLKLETIMDSYFPKATINEEVEAAPNYEDVEMSSGKMAAYMNTISRAHKRAVN